MRFNTEHDIKVTLAPRKWEQLKRGLCKQAESLTKVSPITLRCEDDSPHEMRLYRVDDRGVVHKSVRLTFRPNVPVILYDGPEGEGSVTFLVRDDDLLYVLDGMNHTPK